MFKKTIQQALKQVAAKIDRKLFGRQEFVIISNNCWGAEIYKRLKKPYNTPFVGLFLYGPDYLKLVERFDHYMAQPLTFASQSVWSSEPVKYPIGKLDDIEVHFLHYRSADEAAEKWNRRLSRMKQVTDKNKYYFKICDRDLTTPALIERFHKAPLTNKISFGIAPVSSKNHIIVTEGRDKTSVPDGVILYQLGFKYVDVFKWIKTGKFSNNVYGKIKSLAGIA